jgi:gamma-glutamyl-gamma-aminobutyrate hydrolase PuuD
MPPARGQAPLIVVTVITAAREADPAVAARKIALCTDSVARHGARALPLDATASAADRAAAFAAMDGLLLTGGGDVEPARYGQQPDRSAGIDTGRDELEAAAWAVAEERARR